MKRRLHEDLSVIQRTQDFIIWALDLSERMPKSLRFSQGNRLLATSYDLLYCLIDAKFKKDKQEELAKANFHVDCIRNHLQILLKSNAINGGKFLHASELLFAIGVEIGAWRRKQKDKL